MSTLPRVELYSQVTTICMATKSSASAQVIAP